MLFALGGAVAAVGLVSGGSTGAAVAVLSVFMLLAVVNSPLPLDRKSVV